MLRTRASSPRRRALTRLSILTSLCLFAGGCAATPAIDLTLAAVNCGRLVPPSYRTRIPPAPLPPLNDLQVGQVLTFSDHQTAKLEQAQGRTEDVIAIIDTCDQSNAGILKAMQPKPPAWQFWRRGD